MLQAPSNVRAIQMFKPSVGLTREGGGAGGHFGHWFDLRGYTGHIWAVVSIGELNAGEWTGCYWHDSESDDSGHADIATIAGGALDEHFVADIPHHTFLWSWPINSLRRYISFSVLPIGALAVVDVAAHMLVLQSHGTDPARVDSDWYPPE